MSAPTESGLGALNGRVTLWLARAGAVGLALIMILTFIDVVGRYAFNAPLVATVEVTELLMGMMIYLGVGLTTHNRGHIKVDIVFDRLPPRLQAIFELITLGISIALMALICWQLWLRSGVVMDKGDTTQILEWSIWPVAYLISAASIFLVTSLVLQFCGVLGRVMRGR